MSMRVRVILPSGVLLDRAAEKVVAEAPNGVFCLLPRHLLPHPSHVGKAGHHGR